MANAYIKFTVAYNFLSETLEHKSGKLSTKDFKKLQHTLNKYVSNNSDFGFNYDYVNFTMIDISKKNYTNSYIDSSKFFYEENLKQVYDIDVSKNKYDFNKLDYTSTYTTTINANSQTLKKYIEKLKHIIKTIINKSENVPNKSKIIVSQCDIFFNNNKFSIKIILVHYINKKNKKRILVIIQETNSASAGPTGLSLNVVTKLQKATSQIVALIKPGDFWTGSGFYYYETIDDLKHGYFVTASHCVSDLKNNVYSKIIEAYIQDPTNPNDNWFKIDVSAIYVDGVADIALIKTGIDFTNYPEYCLKINKEIVKSGDVCYLVGNPLGIDEDSISYGNVRDPHYCEPNGDNITDRMHISSPTESGNSGGPIVNANADVIGILTHSAGIYTNGIGNCLSGGSNQYVLSNSLSVLKQQETDYKNKLYLGFRWGLPLVFVLKQYYVNNILPPSNYFSSEGVFITYIDSFSPFFGYLNIDDLILSCTLHDTSNSTTTISFGNKTDQRTPGLLLYYPVGTIVDISYRRIGDFINSINRTVSITLSKTYAEVDPRRDVVGSGGAGINI